MSFTVPEACTLPTVDQPVRTAEFDQLFSAAVRGVETVAPTHIRLHLAGPAGLTDRVRDLVARESRCCSFFSFTVTPERTTAGEALTVDIEVPASSVSVLDSLTARAAAAVPRP